MHDPGEGEKQPNGSHLFPTEKINYILHLATMQHTTTPFTFSAELVKCFSHKLIRTKGSYYCDTHAWTGKIEQNITISIAHEHTAHSEMMRTSLPANSIPAAARRSGAV